MSLNGQQWLAAFHRRLQNANAVVAEEGLEILKESVSEPYPPASSADMPPHMRTGELLEGLKATHTENSITFISTATYSGYLEYGTHKMAPRPFMRPHQLYMKRHYKEMLERILKKGV
jgi:HK97 gp10 family phage protein